MEPNPYQAPEHCAIPQKSASFSVAWKVLAIPAGVFLFLIGMVQLVGGLVEGAFPQIVYGLIDAPLGFFLIYLAVRKSINGWTVAVLLSFLLFLIWLLASIFHF